MANRAIIHSGIVCSHPQPSVAAAYQDIMAAALHSGFHAVVGLRFVGNKHVFRSATTAGHYIQAYGTGIVWQQ
ncbi:hypothetical protein ACWDV4_04000 [Micromonospora sp. NPDC003197]